MSQVSNQESRTFNQAASLFKNQFQLKKKKKKHQNPIQKIQEKPSQVPTQPVAGVATVEEEAEAEAESEVAPIYFFPTKK